ncbi:hypothetical protein CCH79_00014332 [Gambusia affinis]|uniref:NXPE C-terminal domain-containing protein n=1 Tax=Gambusia affinis TaxID=33528 RepID=A0A315UWL8_GAMAF|nr:hypothetical protein CCH79_00014332 [Gambusia affinis]
MELENHSGMSFSSHCGSPQTNLAAFREFTALKLVANMPTPPSVTWKNGESAVSGMTGVLQIEVGWDRRNTHDHHVHVKQRFTIHFEAAAHNGLREIYFPQAAASALIDAASAASISNAALALCKYYQRRTNQAVVLGEAVVVHITYVTPTKLAPEPNTISPLRPTEPASTCSFHSASPENAAEVNLLKESIAWPETPSVPPDFSLNDTSDPAHSTFTILPRRGGGSWHVGDQLEVLIKISDFHGRPRETGGDLFYARLQNRAVFAGAAGKVLDHRNGSYTAVFSLLWDGNAEVEVSLVHPSEAITVLAKVTQEYPDRAYFLSVFRSGSITETVRCNVCLKGPKEKLCNYTDLHTGEPWFCYKPKKLTCDNRITHSKGGFSFKPESKENQLFQRGVNMKVSIPSFGPSSIKILPKLKDGTNEIVKTNPAGYYYQGAWQALDGTTVRQFNNASARTQCLKGKVVHLYGDSTVRQFFEFLTENTPGRRVAEMSGNG